MAAVANDVVWSNMTHFGWLYYVLGNVFIIVHCVLAQLKTEPPLKPLIDSLGLQWVFDRVLYALLRCFGEWLFMIGLLGLCRRYVRGYHNILKTLVLIAMPFYVIHLQVVVNYFCPL